MPAHAALALVTRAASFACEAHTTHRRKGDAAEPYVNHLAEVAMLLAMAGADSNLVAAGYLHDTIEDTTVTYDELTIEFGRDIADLVRAVTDDNRLGSVERKALQIERAAALPVRAQMLRVCDKISNLRALRSSPPSGWSAQRKLAYCQWAKQVVEQCRAVSPQLVKIFDESMAAGMKAIETQV